MTLAAIALGGAIGSVLRYLVGGAVQRFFAAGFPFGTLAVNLLGCMIVGVVGQLFMNAEPPSAVRGLLVVGFCGGFTTFSAFSYETVGLINGGEYARAALYVLCSSVLCVMGTAAGMVVARALTR